MNTQQNHAPGHGLQLLLHGLNVLAVGGDSGAKVRDGAPCDGQITLKGSVRHASCDLVRTEGVGGRYTPRTRCRVRGAPGSRCTAERAASCARSWTHSTPARTESKSARRSARAPQDKPGQRAVAALVSPSAAVNPTTHGIELVLLLGTCQAVLLRKPDGCGRRPRAERSTVSIHQTRHGCRLCTRNTHTAPIVQ